MFRRCGRRFFASATAEPFSDLDRTLCQKAVHELQGFPLVTRVDLLWGQQDSFGHVNNVRHLQFFETSRCLYFRHIQQMSGRDFTNSPSVSRGDSVGPILANVTAKYTAILEWPNVIAVGARISHYMRDRTRFQMQHKIVVASSGLVVAVGHGDVAVLDYASNKTVALPRDLQEAINAFEGRAVPDEHSKA